MVTTNKKQSHRLYTTTSLQNGKQPYMIKAKTHTESNPLHIALFLVTGCVLVVAT